MLGTGRLVLRQAQEAIAHGRLEEAKTLLSQQRVRGHKKTWDLLRQVGEAHLCRADRYLQNDEVSSAWNELLKAEQTGTDLPETRLLRKRFTERGLADLKRFLKEGQPARALECAAQMLEKSLQHPEINELTQVAEDWVKAVELADRGEFGPAFNLVEKTRSVSCGADNAIRAFEMELVTRQEVFADKAVALHKAGQQRRWADVLRLSDEVLSLAPNHVESQRLRSKAWKALETETFVGETQSYHVKPKPPEPRSTSSSQFLLWIDGVGGYLVCLSNEIRIGQAVTESRVDIPVFADVSRHHASIWRDSEGYLLQGFRPVEVNGHTVEKTLLSNGDRVTIGSSCQFRFWQSVPISTSAAFDITSGHRLRFAVDGVLLMADNLVLGGGSQAHVALPNLSKPVILYRDKTKIGVRHAGKFRINGQRQHERGIVEPGATVTGDDFSLAVEPVAEHGV